MKGIFPSSKMRATVTDDAVVFDKNVPNFFQVPFRNLPQCDDWLERLLQRHQRGGMRTV
jgi:hypothetical protein